MEPVGSLDTFQPPCCTACLEHHRHSEIQQNTAHLAAHPVRSSTPVSMQALRRGRGFLQAAAAELSAGRMTACGAQTQSHAHSSAAQPSTDNEDNPLQRFFRTANVAADPEVMGGI